MQVGLLNPWEDKLGKSGYSFYQELQQDLNLSYVYRFMADGDDYIYRAVQQVMMVPLTNEEDISYRQEAVKDCVKNRESIARMYSLASNSMQEVEKYKLQKERERNMSNIPLGTKIKTSIDILQIMINDLSSFMVQVDDEANHFPSRAFNQFFKRLKDKYTVKFIKELQEAILSMLYFISNGEVTMSASLGEGFCGNKIVINDLRTGAKQKRFAKKIKKMYTMFFQRNAISLDDIEIQRDVYTLNDAGLLHLLKLNQDFIREMTEFYENLRFQLAFYAGCGNLYRMLKDHRMPLCMPEVSSEDNLLWMRFEGLYDLSLGLLMKKTPVTNDWISEDVRLMVISGANQGGKSTFLRSIGIAQVMMQSGLFVAADSFRACLCNDIFSHFTRREDQAMNSGALDGELKRMEQIIGRVQKSSLVLLNESFSSTTEIEGSKIMSDIIQALYEEGIRVIMVTHLFEFINNLYSERPEHATFLSAERKEDGERTYKVLPAEPSYTSFGMDLYDEVIGGSLL